MKLTPLLENNVDLASLNRLAVDLQSILMDLDFVELDAEISKVDNGVLLTYFDKHKFVNGTIRLTIKRLSGGFRYVYVIYANDNVLINSGNVPTPARLLFWVFQSSGSNKKTPYPYVTLESNIVSTFATTRVDAVDAGNLESDEVYGFSVQLPFKLKHKMVHTKRQLGAEGVYLILTRSSSLRVYLSDPDDISAIGDKLGEITKIEDAWPLIANHVESMDTKATTLPGGSHV